MSYNKTEKICKLGDGQGLQLTFLTDDNLAVYVKDDYSRKWIVSRNSFYRYNI